MTDRATDPSVRVTIRKSASGARTWDLQVDEGADPAEVERVIALALNSDNAMRERTRRSGIKDWSSRRDDGGGA
jgi:hypothetical protein